MRFAVRDGVLTRAGVLLLAAIPLSTLSLLSGCSQNTGSAGATPNVAQAPPASDSQSSSPSPSQPPVKLPAPKQPKQNSKTRAGSHSKSQSKTAALKIVQSKTIRWHTNWNAAFKQARAQQKPVMVDFYADWCGACHYLDEKIYSAPTVVEQSRNFVCVKVDADKQPEIARLYVGQGLPTIAFLDDKGNILMLQEGAPREPELFVQWMQEAHAKTAGTAA